MDTCPDCGLSGCSPNCPGPGDFTICNNCGSNAPVRDGGIECTSCGNGYEAGSMFDTDPESANNRRFPVG